MAAIVSGIVGTAVTLVWFLGATLARWPSVKFNTGICLILTAGAMLLLVQRRARLLAGGLALAVVLISGGSFLEDLAGIDLGMDQLVVEDVRSVSGAHPGRIAPVVALALTLIGASLAAEALGISTIAQVIAWLAGVVAASGAIAYVYGAVEILGLGHARTIPPIGALLLIGLAAGALFLNPDRGVLPAVRSSPLGGRVIRQLVPAAIGIPVVSGWLFLQGERLGWYDGAVATALVVISTMTLLSIVIWINARLIGNLEQRRQEAEVQVIHVSALAESRAEALASHEAQGARQRMEALGQLAGSIAHDVNNMMTIVTGYASVRLKETPRSSQAWTQLEEIRKAADRCSALTRQLLAFSRQQVLRPVVIDLGERIASLTGMLPMIVGEDIRLVTKRQPELWHTRADPSQIDQVVVNLAVNARDAMPGGGTLEIATDNVELAESAQRPSGLPPGQYVRLSISDTGVGMDQATLERVFEPFFTTKPAGTGTGLGLSSVYGIVMQSQGGIEAQSGVGAGTTFRIYLPRVTAPIAVPLPELDAVTGTETILLAEDDTGVRELMKMVLDRAGYEVIEASDGIRASLIGRTHNSPIHLLVTDVVMPGLSGVDLAREFERTHPQTRIILISGYTRYATDIPTAAFLQKPFTPDALLKLVRETLDRG